MSEKLCISLIEMVLGIVEWGLVLVVLVVINIKVGWIVLL